MTKSFETGRCPMCNAATERSVRPFCSKRCADLDLARWLRGDYAIPGPPATAEDLTRTDDEPQNKAGDSNL